MESPVSAPMQRASGHVPSLDGLRGIAILLVMLHHFVPIPGNRVLFRADEGPSAILLNFAYAGWAGVDLFFVLSGFLITGVLLDSRGSAYFFGRFFARRVLRIFPLYYVAIASAYLWLRGADDGRLAAFMDLAPWLASYTANVSMAIHRGYDFIFGSVTLAHFWSLAVEEQFYLLWPFAVSRLRPDTLKRVCVGLVISACVFRCVAWLGFGNFFLATCQLPGRWDSLAAGALVAIAIRERPSISSQAVRRLGIVSVTAVAFTFVDERVVYCFGYSALAAFFTWTLLLALAKPTTGILCWAPLRWVGRYSYGLYVWHLAVLAGVRHLLNAGPSTTWACVLPALAGSFAIAWVSWELVEKRFLGLKNRFAPDSFAVVSGATRS